MQRGRRKPIKYVTSSSRFSDFRIYDASDGIKINRFKYGRNVSRRQTAVSIYEHENVFLDSFDGFNKEVGIMLKIRKVNKYKGIRINTDQDQLNRRA